MKTLFSGIQPTGNIHIGNYLGAVKNWVDLQDKYACIFSVVDYHALSGNMKPEELHQNIFDATVDLLAVGIDPKKSIIFQQSKVIGHTELAWIFNCITPIGELGRMTQFKEKSDQANHQGTNTGLLMYPVLQAADILLYLAEAVPVGEDQLQHLELTRIIARKFNNKYGQFFPETKPVLSPTPRVMSLHDPSKKMSKSLGDRSYIAIRDDAETIKKKIKKAVADDKGIKNLLELYSYFGTTKKHQQMVNDYKAGKLMNSELKEELSRVVIKFLEPVQGKIKEYEKNPKKVYEILEHGARDAQKIADKNLTKINKIVGIN
ncbi:tryptophan--tRNA ligase [Candidatus Parcubacteria bacterium]|jgi:tryptophanyl-tRNA synthetase|nr:tryptophan--tRNA ligase [Candidatus Parcubacteria bacterium]